MRVLMYKVPCVRNIVGCACALTQVTQPGTCGNAFTNSHHQSATIAVVYRPSFLMYCCFICCYHACQVLYPICVLPVLAFRL